MFSIKQKREISDAIQKILRDTNHPELPQSEIRFNIHVEGEGSWSWADILNNGSVVTPDAPQHCHVFEITPKLRKYRERVTVRHETFYKEAVLQQMFKCTLCGETEWQPIEEILSKHE